MGDDRVRAGPHQQPLEPLGVGVEDRRPRRRVGYRVEEGSAAGPGHDRIDHEAGRTALFDPVPDTTPGAAVLNANAERLERLLLGPGPYAVVAHRPR